MVKLAPVASPEVSTVLFEAGSSVHGVLMTGEGPLVGAEVVGEDLEDVWDDWEDWDDCVGDGAMAEGGVLLADV